MVSLRGHTAMSHDKDSSRNRAEKAGKPMAPKTDKTKAVDAGKATNPTGETAKSHGAETAVKAKNEPG
jgi:hypothetical protein